MSGTTSQDGAWKARERSEEACYAHEKEQAQLRALRDTIGKDASTNTSDASTSTSSKPGSMSEPTHGYEGGFGGQEDLVDKYATTSGEH
ncbi:hypothetical protein BDV98DRAFT_588159 [Pterulicium gracile]|uniref:Uncharacterized protein n=1 Tax=Pterulicium gracile TaxID=1884261 RepID=A0A5C3R0J0_9AGAR|nr:hypothetical protein BDV98DRAFT_588159 [Pterula gracilis]